MTGEKALVRSERRGPTLFITIDREDRRNALNKQVIAGIDAAFAEAESDYSVRAVVLTAKGEKAFCAGADLSSGTGTFTLGLDEPKTDLGRLFRRVKALPVPVIARVNGDCLAGGMGLLAMCDLAVAADHARFGLPEGKVGVFPMQVLALLRGIIGARHINELCFLGDFISAARAYEMGLVNRVVPFGELDQATDAMIERIGLMSPVAFRRGKYAIAAMEMMDFPQAIAFTVASLTSDATAGLAAFNERRKPRWVEAKE
jgi:enoyl-CoA hydratase/carnithine racemase